MDIVKGKRKAEVLNKEELQDFAALVNQETQAEENKIRDENQSSIDNLPKARKHYTDEIKKKAIELVGKHGYTVVSEHSKIHENNLKLWIKDENKVKNKKGRKIRFPEFENELLTYISENRQNQRPVTSRTIFTRTKLIKKKLKIPDDPLKCRWGWFQKFLARNKLSLRAPNSKIVSPLSHLQSETEKFKSLMAPYFTSSNKLIFNYY